MHYLLDTRKPAISKCLQITPLLERLEQNLEFEAVKSATKEIDMKVCFLPLNAYGKAGFFFLIAKNKRMLSFITIIFIIFYYFFSTKINVIRRLPVLDTHSFDINLTMIACARQGKKQLAWAAIFY